MIPGMTAVTPDGAEHVFVESWSPDGLAGPARLTPRRIRYTFVNKATGERWTTEDPNAFTMLPARKVGA